ncbi:MAG: DUF1549 domain-containing protein [Verrucomicrobiota bacterium]
MLTFPRILWLLVLTPLISWADPAPIDFNNDIRPILSDNCFHCHGPDSKNQKSSFRLDTEEHLFADLGGYFGVKPGSLEDSEIHWRITSEDADDVMPPPDSNRSLTPKEIELLDRWIEEGAPYDGHWAFQTPNRPAVPSLDAWAENPVDQFILRRLKAESIEPSSAATPETLLRRAALVLTGLLPPPEAMERFLADPSPENYQKELDHLFESMAYAERQTLKWLDAARFADTDGYQNDAERSNWPWRDWVIQSYHDNLSFDQFTIQQLAGDMLPEATENQILASAFNRNPTSAPL